MIRFNPVGGGGTLPALRFACQLGSSCVENWLSPVDSDVRSFRDCTTR